MKTEVYISKNQPDLKGLIDFLEKPVHSKSLISSERVLQKDEIDLSKGFYLENLIENTPELTILFDDFKKFMTVCMETPLNGDGYKFIIKLEKIADLPRNSCEAFEIEVKRRECLVRTADIAGLRRAFVYLEDEMTLRRFPALCLGKKCFYLTVRTRISRSPISSYRFGSGWELENDDDSYPDEYLNGLAHCGINAVWVAGIFRNLIKSKILPEATLEASGPGLKKLRKLVERAGRYGIKVYLFCMEPRNLPSGCEVFEKHPETRGRSWFSGGEWRTSLCISSDLVQEYMKESVTELFKAVPNLAGMIQIFAGERITGCRTQDDYGDKSTSCEKCFKRSRGEVLVDTLNLYNRTMKKIAPHAELIAWSYGMWRKDRNVKEFVMDHMNPDIVWLENFEHDGKKRILGHLIKNTEYSLSYLGPCPEFKNISSRSQNEFHRKDVFAKIQLGTTYELSAIPYIPVPASVHEKFKFINRSETPGVFATWLLGGYPDMMLKASGEASLRPMPRRDVFLKRLAGIYWGEELAERVTCAWNHFFQAFQNYPIDENTFYYGPITRCPAYHLQLESEDLEVVVKRRYNWGIDRERNQQPYYDVLNERCLGQFKNWEVIGLYRKMAEKWKKGVEILRAIVANDGTEANHREVALAAAALIQFDSAANVYEFYWIRDRWLAEKSPEMSDRLAEIIKNEIELALQMKTLLRQDPRLGFHSELLYYVISEELLDLKIEQSRNTLEKLISLQSLNI